MLLRVLVVVVWWVLAWPAAHRDFEGMEKRRRRAARLFDKGATQAEVARQLGVSRQSVSRWYADVSWCRRSCLPPVRSACSRDPARTACRDRGARKPYVSSWWTELSALDAALSVVDWRRDDADVDAARPSCHADDSEFPSAKGCHDVVPMTDDGRRRRIPATQGGSSRRRQGVRRMQPDR
jgi:Homeodomain-like domain